MTANSALGSVASASKTFHDPAQICIEVRSPHRLYARKYVIVRRVSEPEAQSPLGGEERDGMVTAVKSVFSRLRKLYTQISPTFVEYGFKPPSPGVLARELSEKIETAIVQHCETFSRGHDHCDLCRSGFDWEVKISKKSGLTINQSKMIAGETYIVVNYTADVQVKKIWVLWRSDDAMFSARKSNSNARAVRVGQAQEQIEILYKASSGNAKSGLAKIGKPKSAKAELPARNSAKITTS